MTKSLSSGQIKYILGKRLKEAQKKFDSLQKEFEQYKKESINWSVEDVTETATNMGYKIPKTKAQDALEDMIRHHDATTGICWEAIKYYVEKYGNKLKKKKP